MSTQVESPRLQAIASLLSREICRPIDSLEANLVRLLDDPTQLPSPAERSHAATMLTLCEDLRRLTWDCLGDGTPAGGAEESAAPTPAPGVACSPRQQASA